MAIHSSTDPKMRVLPCMESRTAFTLLQTVYKAPELTEAVVASIRKKWIGGIGGRTRNEGGATNSTVPWKSCISK